MQTSVKASSEAKRVTRNPAIVAAVLAIAGWGTVLGQTYTTTVPGDIMDQFYTARTLWTTGVWSYANKLFGILAVIEFAWSAAIMVLEKTDLQSWTAALVRKIMWIGAFYALLVNGSSWIPAIIESFNIIGKNAAGLSAPLSPADVFAQGLFIAGALMDSASTSAFFTNPGSSLALAFAALLIVLSYTIITINFIVTVVESYVIVSVGYIFLGFGGSRWTAPYVERYIGLAVSIGIKIILLYCLISAGLGLGIGWATEAHGVGTSTRPALAAFDVMGAALIFMMLCWQIPKLFSAVLGGSPALTGGDLMATAGGLVLGGVAAATAAYSLGGSAAGSIRSLAGISAAANVPASPSVALAGQNGGSSSVSPPSDLAAGRGMTSSGQPDPPAVPSTSTRLPEPPSTPSRQGELFPRIKRLGRGIASDGAPPASPPRMPIDQDD